MWNFNKAFDRITEAYIKNQIIPNSACGCFVGNLLNGSSCWISDRTSSFSGAYNWDYVINSDVSSVKSAIKKFTEDFYSPEDIFDLEKVFMTTYRKARHCFMDHEDSIFEAMSTTIDFLRDIHVEKGESIEGLTFSKREAPKVLLHSNNGVETAILS